MNNKLEQFANSGFMKKLQEWSVKLSQSPAFGTISQGMGGSVLSEVLLLGGRQENLYMMPYICHTS